MRVDALRAAGVKHCPPIYALQVHDIGQSGSFLLSRNAWRIDNGPVNEDTFWEGYVKTRGGNGTSMLSAYLRGTPEFREWLLSERELLVQEYLLPLLLRIARAPEPRARYDAIEAILLLHSQAKTEALLLLDAEYNEVLQILRDSIRRPKKEPPGLSELERLRFHDVDPARANELVKQFDLADVINEQ